MFILSPDPFLMPAYRISPFTTADIRINNCLPDSDLINEYLIERFGFGKFVYTLNGRDAINMAISHYDLKEDDVVTILTTSENFYISGCVTKEIEKFCKWSRKMEADTRLIFVNHEFGYPYDDLIKLKEYKLPIIEDCANSFFSKDKNNSIGEVGDFVIYSFPKMFPLQVGGLLVANRKTNSEGENRIAPEMLRHIKNVLSNYINTEKEITNKRINNYNYLKEKFGSLGFVERFNLEPGVIPSVFMFRTDTQNLNLPELKNHFYSHGVQCSIFYGEETFFIPAHQTLTELDMDYFFEIMKSFIKSSKP